MKVHTHKSALTLGALLTFGFTAPMSKPAQAGDVVDKLTVGYQGWFRAPGDNSRVNNWRHSAPGPEASSFDLWPDTREYPKLYDTAFPDLPGDVAAGIPARKAQMFSSYDSSTVDTHFRWMREYDIGTAALQRFAVEIGTGGDSLEGNNRVAMHVREAAEENGRKFYVMYDISSWRRVWQPLVDASGPNGVKTITDVLAQDWNTQIKTLGLLDSPAYAKENGKPVVSIFGLGYERSKVTPSETLDLVNWFKGQGYYVIGSIPNNFLSNNNYKAYYEAYKQLDMVLPWSVGMQGDGLDSLPPQYLEFAKTNGMELQPLIYPGFSFYYHLKEEKNRIPRNGGQFMWDQFRVLKKNGIKTAYVAMFDEIDEGTAIFKAAENAAMRPADTWFLSLDADGKELSSDFYLRLTRAGQQMINGEIPDSPTPPIPAKN